MLRHNNTKDKINYRLIYNRLNLTNADEPFFIIDSLDAFTSYDSYGDDALRAVVYSVNQKGRSHGVVVKEFQIENGVESRAGEFLRILSSIFFYFQVQLIK